MKASLRSLSCLFSLLVPAVACAAATPTVIDNHNGKMVHVPRRDLRFSGPSFEVRHRQSNPLARGASTGQFGDGGSLSGRVCGSELSLNVQHGGDHLVLSGEVAGAETRLLVEDRAGERSVRGWIGNRHVELSLDERQVTGGLDGHLLRLNWPELGGALAQMPAADQAAVLPLLLLCAESQARSDNQGL